MYLVGQTALYYVLNARGTFAIFVFNIYHASSKTFSWMLFVISKSSPCYGNEFMLHSSFNHYSCFYFILFYFLAGGGRYPKQFFSILIWRSSKSLHVNILYIKAEFHLFSKFSNCRSERSTCVTHTSSNTHLILITKTQTCQLSFSNTFKFLLEFPWWSVWR